MTASLDRRSALAVLGVGGAAAAFPRTLHAANPHPWLATPAQVAAERMVLELLQDPAVKRLQAKLREELAASPRARAIPDAARRADEALAQWTNSLIFAELAKDTARPAFLWGTDDTPREWLGHRLGGVGTSGDNPDAIYRTAGIEGGGRYEIIGQYHRESRPTQVLIEVHTTDIARPHTMMGPAGGGKAPDPQAQTQIDQDQFVVDRDGRFRITLGGEAGGPNHLPLPASGFCTIGVRDILSDWRLRACGLSIRRLDRVAARSFGMAQVRELVLRDLEGYVGFWSRFPDIWFGGLKPNAHSQPQQRPGGWGFVAGLNFHLAPDEAMVVTTSPGGARYTGFQLTDPWMIAADVRRHQMSLNITQASPNANGTVTYVIAASDPGAANWLDTAGCHDGLGIIRWQAVPPELTGQGLLREVRVIKLGEVARLPGLPRVTPAERLARVAARKADYETRTR